MIYDIPALLFRYDCLPSRRPRQPYRAVEFSIFQLIFYCIEDLYSYLFYGLPLKHDHKNVLLHSQSCLAPSPLNIEFILVC